jgi:hypothetical protein
LLLARVCTPCLRGAGYDVPLRYSLWLDLAVVGALLAAAALHLAGVF